MNMMLHKHYVGIYRSRAGGEGPSRYGRYKGGTGATLHKPWLFMSNP
jgi:hypothetical protein